MSGSEEITAILLACGEQCEPYESSEETISAKTLSVAEAKALREPNAKKAKNLFLLVAQTSNVDGFEQLAASFDTFGRRGYHDAGLNIEESVKVWDRTKVVMSKGDYSWWHSLQRQSPFDGVRKQLLKDAIQCEDIDMVRNVLQLSIDAGKDLSTETVSRPGAKYVHVAAYSGSPEIMRLLINTGLTLQATDDRGMAPLHYACRTGTYEVIEVLLESGVEVDQMTERTPYTPLMVLLQYGSWRTRRCPGDTLKILKALIAKGASISARDANGNTVLHFATLSYDPTVIQTLLDLGADAGALSNSLISPLQFIATGFQQRYGGLSPEREGFSRTKYGTGDVPTHFVQASVNLLISVSPLSSLTEPMEDGSSLLAAAIHSRRWILARALYQLRAPFISTLELSSDLDEVSNLGFCELTRLLIDQDARPGKADIFAEICVSVPALKPHLWARYPASLNDAPGGFPLQNHERTVRELAALTGVDINIESGLPQLYFKMTAIQVATERGVDAGLVAALLDGGANPYVETREGLDSFLLALLCGKADNLTVLLEHAIAHPPDDHWLTNWLRSSGLSNAPDEQATFESYIAAIADADLVNAWDMNGHSLLFLAVGRENQLLVEELLRLGADPNLADPLGWTSFHEAVRVENVPLAKLLVDHGADIYQAVSNVSPYSAFSSFGGSAVAHNGPLIPAMNSLHIAVGANPHPMDLEARARLSPDMVEFLLDLGLDPNEKTRHTSALQVWDLREEEAPLQIMFRPWRYTWSPTFFRVVQMLTDRGADAAGIADRMKPDDVAGFEGYEALWEYLRAA